MKICFVLLCIIACVYQQIVVEGSRAKDHFNWDVAIATRGTSRSVTAKNFRYVVSSHKEQLKVPLPPEIDVNIANNCVGIEMFQNRLFVAWRSAPSHFASSKTRLFIMSSQNIGSESWEYEHTIYLEHDIREPYFMIVNELGKTKQSMLQLSFFQAGTDPLAFQPKKLLRIHRIGFQNWTNPEEWGHQGEIMWEFKEHILHNETDKPSYFITSYSGNHYDPGESNLLLFFNYSMDGITWNPISSKYPYRYKGGISETGFAFDLKGDLWAVMRNEDGDDSGFGSRIAHASSTQLHEWSFYPSNYSDPNIYESPRMFRYGDDMYLIARKDLHPPYDRAPHFLPFSVRKYINLVEYSSRAHTTAMYRIDKNAKRLQWVMDLPGCGDTAFPSILRTGEHSFLVANYASPLEHKDWSWIHGQTSSEGTQIYFIELEFNE